MALLKQKHPNGDFFIADIFDSTVFKNDLATMEHPFFSLSKKPLLSAFNYQNGSTEITVTPHATLGMPTIFDKDLLLYCCSILMDELNTGRIPPKTFHISLNDFFIATNRDNGGKAYDKAKDALDRLAGCYVKTNLKTNGKRQINGFTLLSYGYVESLKVKNRHINVQITLCDWYYNSILGREVVSINKDYFRLGKPLERRLYELARKHCGNQKEWSIGLDKLFEKSGSRDRLAKFKAALKVIIEDANVPDYQYSLDHTDKVVVRKRNILPNCISPDLELSVHDRALYILSQLKKATITRAKKIHEDSYTDWSMQEIAIQYVQYMEKKGTPKTLDGSFIGFLKKKVQTFKKDSVTC